MLLKEPKELMKFLPAEWIRHESFHPYLIPLFGRLFFGRIKKINKFFLKTNKRFPKALEVGGGFGLFSLNFKLNHPKIEVTLSDILPLKRMNIIKKIISNKLGINLNYYADCDIQKKTSYLDGYFDLIFALDVIEHVFDPEAALKELLRILNKNGILFISVPVEGIILKIGRYFYSKIRETPKDIHWSGKFKSIEEFSDCLKRHCRILEQIKYPFNFLSKSFAYNNFYIVKKY